MVVERFCQSFHLGRGLPVDEGTSTFDDWRSWKVEYIS
jgi:hypothetical protein